MDDVRVPLPLPPLGQRLTKTYNYSTFIPYSFSQYPDAVSEQFQRRYPILDRLVSIEAFLIQIVAYLLIWLLNDYLAFILSFILGGIALFLYLVAKIVELVDRSRVPKVYYRFMVIGFVAPLIAGGLGLLLRNGPSWL